MPDNFTYRIAFYLMLLIFLGLLHFNPLFGQELKPKLAEFGTEPLNPQPDSLRYQRFYAAENEQDSIFLIQLTNLSTF